MIKRFVMVLGLLVASEAQALVVSDPSLVLLIDGNRDTDTTVELRSVKRDNIATGMATLTNYDIGYVSGGSFTPIPKWMDFDGGTTMDFAIRAIADDGYSSAGTVYSISNSNDYVDFTFRHMVIAADSEKPVVTDDYFKRVDMYWDLDRNGVWDVGWEMVRTGKSYDDTYGDGLFFAPVPLPPAVFLFGSALVGLAIIGRRRRV